MRWRITHTVHLPSDHGGSGDTFTKSIDVRVPNDDDGIMEAAAIKKADAKLRKYLAAFTNPQHMARLEIKVKSAMALSPS